MLWGRKIYQTWLADGTWRCSRRSSQWGRVWKSQCIRLTQSWEYPRPAYWNWSRRWRIRYFRRACLPGTARECWRWVRGSETRARRSSSAQPVIFERGISISYHSLSWVVSYRIEHASPSRLRGSIWVYKKVQEFRAIALRRHLWFDIRINDKNYISPFKIPKRLLLFQSHFGFHLK